MTPAPDQARHRIRPGTGTGTRSQQAARIHHRRPDVDPGLDGLLGPGLAARGLILENAFDKARHVGLAHFPSWLVNLLHRSEFDSLGKLPHYKGPLLQIHSERDEVVPFALGRNLFEVANPPKQFVSLPGMGHNGRTTWTARASIEAFLERLPPVRSH